MKSSLNQNIIRMVKSPQGANCIKSKNSKVLMPIELNDKVYNAAATILPKMEKYSEMSGYPIIFAPLADTATLMNYGAKTLYINNSMPEKEIVTRIEKHINEVL